MIIVFRGQLGFSGSGFRVKIRKASKQHWVLAQADMLGLWHVERKDLSRNLENAFRKGAQAFVQHHCPENPEYATP